MAAANNEKMTDEEILAQMSYVAHRAPCMMHLLLIVPYSTFTLAGMDTTSNALSRIFHLLAQHTDVQDKLRKEILEAQGGDYADIAYDDLVKLPYLDAVCRETLRLYAPVPYSVRQYVLSHQPHPSFRRGTDCNPCAARRKTPSSRYRSPYAGATGAKLPSSSRSAGHPCWCTTRRATSTGRCGARTRSSGSLSAGSRRCRARWRRREFRVCTRICGSFFRSGSFEGRELT